MFLLVLLQGVPCKLKKVVAMKWCIFDSMLVNPKCTWQLVVITAQTRFGFNDLESQINCFRYKCTYFYELSYGTPCTWIVATTIICILQQFWIKIIHCEVSDRQCWKWEIWLCQEKYKNRTTISIVGGNFYQGWK